MAAKKTGNSFSLTLFDIYRKKDIDKPLPEVPTFSYAKDGETRRIPFLQPEEQADKSMRNAFRRLYPLAEKTFKTERMFWTVDANLLKELQGAWQVLGKGPLSVRFQEAGAFLFEEEYLLVYLAVSPDMAETDNEHVAEAAVNMTNALSGRLKKNRTEIVRKFKNDQAKDSARNRFQGNEDLPLIQGILGQALPLEDMFNTLAGPG